MRNAARSASPWQRERIAKLRFEARHGLFCCWTREEGDEDSAFPIRHFYQRWGAAIAVRDRVVREAAEIVQAAYHEVAGS